MRCAMTMTRREFLRNTGLAAAYLALPAWLSACQRQLFEIMVDFWSNHLNIYIGKNQVKWLKTADDREVIRTHALGKFRDLLLASAKSPAMLIYLDNAENVRVGARRGK